MDALRSTQQELEALQTKVGIEYDREFCLYGSPIDNGNYFRRIITLVFAEFVMGHHAYNFERS